MNRAQMALEAAILDLETELADSRREFCHVNRRLNEAVRHIAGLEDPRRAEYEATRRARYVGGEK